MDKVLEFFVLVIEFLGLFVELTLLFAFPTLWLLNYLFTPSVIAAKISLWPAWARIMLFGWEFGTFVPTDKK